MPELPEIETIRRDLELALKGDSVASFEVTDRRLMTKADEARWRTAIVLQPWHTFRRRGKYLLIELANGWQIVFHMRMTGQLIIGESPSTPRLLFRMESARTLGLYDQRRFAEAWLLPPGKVWHKSRQPGPDALTELNAATFLAIVRQRKTRIHPLLMDQNLLAGVGNIYAQEALFKAAIRPSRPGHRITRAEGTRLYHALRETLVTAIEYRGSSSRNYRDASGREGSAQTLHAVYRKGGRPCPTCAGLLRAVRLGGRGSVFCPHCQK